MTKREQLVWQWKCYKTNYRNQQIINACNATRSTTIMPVMQVKCG